MNPNVKVLYIGAGYVGATSAMVAACMCPGIKVFCYDKNPDLINCWKLGGENIPLYGVYLISFRVGMNNLLKNGVLELYKKAQARGIVFSSNISECFYDCHIIFICNPIKGIFINLLQRSINTIPLIVIRSTIPVGGSRNVQSWISKNLRSFDGQINILYNPEFSNQSDNIDDLISPDRVVIGYPNGSNQLSDFVLLLKNFYQKWIDSKKILIVSFESAELIKLGSNAFLAQRISSINTLYALSHRFNGNMDDIIKGIGSDSRIGHKYLKPGLGYGGSCLHKDIEILSTNFNDAFLDEYANYWRKVNLTNTLQLNFVYGELISKISAEFKNDPISESLVAVFGLTYKGQTNDLRLSRSIYMIKKLFCNGVKKIHVYDPSFTASKQFINKRDVLYKNIIQNYTNEKFIDCTNEFDPDMEDSRIEIFFDPYETVKDAKYLFLLTDWKIFQRLDYEKIFNLMAQKPAIFDAVSILNTGKIAKIGLQPLNI